MNFLSKTRLDLKGKTAILRVDLNIEERKVLPTHPRIVGILPTVEFLRRAGARIVIISHRGRPKSEKDVKLSLKPFVGILRKALACKIVFIPHEKLAGDSISETADMVRHSSSDSVFLAENIRFFEEEGDNDIKFAKQIASLGDLYVNDAFGVNHRKAATLSAINDFLPGFAGLLLEKEMSKLSEAIKNPKQPLVVILGGAKISDKIGLINNFWKKAKYFLIGGGMANTFFHYHGIPVGDSLHEEGVDLGFFEKYIGSKIILPKDTSISKRRILDIGSKTAEDFAKIISSAGTIIWNGPMGYFEDERFAVGTNAVMKAVLNNREADIIIGGGETASLFSEKKCPKNVFISTGGGAMLEFLAGEKLPGIEALKNNRVKI